MEIKLCIDILTILSSRGIAMNTIGILFIQINYLLIICFIIKFVDISGFNSKYYLINMSIMPNYRYKWIVDVHGLIYM